MSKIKYPVMLACSALLCACSATVPKARMAAAPPVPAGTAITTAAAALSAEDMKKVEGLYYRAVGAYSNNDMDAALKYIDEISTLYPSYPPAVELRGKLKSVSGVKAAPPPWKP